VHDKSAPTVFPGMSECTIKDVYLLTRMMNGIRLIHHIRVRCPAPKIMNKRRSKDAQEKWKRRLSFTIKNIKHPNRYWF